MLEGFSYRRDMHVEEDIYALFSYENNAMHRAASAYYHEETISSIVCKKKIMEWEYGKSLPTELEGFELFIAPEKPLKITNGSYIILDYSDFSIASNFVIYYNIFRDEFFGEGRVHGIPEINYLFDSHDLAGLATKLEHHLAARLQDIRQKATEQQG